MLASDMDSSGEARQGKGSWTAAVVSNLANSATWRGAPKLQHCSPCGSQTCSLERKQRGEPELQVQKLNIQDSSVGEGLSGIFPRSSEGIVDSADPTAEPLHLSCAQNSWCSKYMTKIAGRPSLIFRRQQHEPLSRVVFLCFQGRNFLAYSVRLQTCRGS